MSKRSLAEACNVCCSPSQSGISFLRLKHCELRELVPVSVLDIVLLLVLLDVISNELQI